jgi:hypothetical protein
VVGTGNDATFHGAQQKRLQNELQFFDSTTVKVEQTTRGVRFHAKIPPAAQPAGAQRMRVKGVYSTYLVCRTWDGNAEGSQNVYVAKPPHLRWYSSAWAGMTILGGAVTFVWSALANNIDGQRTASESGETDQIEIVVPVWQYAANGSGSGGSYDEIWADTPTGGTGVTTVAETPFAGAADPAPTGKKLTLMDDNRNGRYWEVIG